MLNGNLLVQNSSGAVSLTGGNISANNVSFVSAPNANIGVAAQEIDGAVTVTGGTASVGANAGNLNIVSLNLTGDPLFYNSGGSLNLPLTNGTFSTSSGDFVALASGNITATGVTTSSTVDATNANGVGGAITIDAGATFSINGGSSPITCSSCSSLFSITGASHTGGSVLLGSPGASGSVNFKTNSNYISIQANAGSSSTGDIDFGNAETSGAGGGVSLATIGLPGGNGGSINISAAGAVNSGSLQAYGGGGGGYIGAGGVAGKAVP